MSKEQQQLAHRFVMEARAEGIDAIGGAAVGVMMALASLSPMVSNMSEAIAFLAGLANPMFEEEGWAILPLITDDVRQDN